jgi:secondary thiamine-phosphate synthase enzyme
MQKLVIKSDKKKQALNITQIVARVPPLDTDGFLHLFCPHSTAALLISEYEEKLARDLERVSELLFTQYEPFEHDDNNNPNAPAHILSSTMGVSIWIPVQEGKLSLGKYQKIVFLELDGPKERRVMASFIES